jgi:DHA1 family bicyclomycin/chloramphenicol resistance-like MFS transporter
MGVLTFSLASIIGAALGFWQSASALPILTLMAICGVGGLLWHRLVLPTGVFSV